MGRSPAAPQTSIETNLIRKLRKRIIPFVFVLFVINFLDRANIAFAALTMNKELAITSQQYGFVAGIFFLGYFIFEVPSNLMLHKVGARIWIARILISWGIMAVLTGFVKIALHLYIVRFLLGVAEAGFFPGIAAAGIALINSIGNLGGFVGPYAMGAISKTTGSFQGGLVFAGISLFMSALFVLALQKKTEPHAAGGTAIEQCR